MTHLKVVAAALLVFALSACVGIVVPIPLASSTTTQDTDRNDSR